MLGSSRASLAAVSAVVDERLVTADAAALAGDLLSIAALLDDQRALRVTLADPGQPTEARAGLVTALLDGKVGTDALSVLQAAVAARWSADADLVAAVQQSGAQAALAAAEAAGTADRVEEELFRFGRLLNANGELALTLSSPSIATATKQALITDLLAGKADATTATLVDHVVAHPLGRTVAQAVEALAELAAQRRGRLLADVTVARPLTDAQAERLTAVLGRIYGRGVDLQVTVDADVVGGVQVRVGDEIIDGTLASRLEQARRRVAG
jgi:F-type H+-transporting ATPase subunit delta